MAVECAWALHGCLRLRSGCRPMLRPAPSCCCSRALITLLLACSSGAKKVKKKQEKAPPFPARCSACLAVAADLGERFVTVADRQISEMQLLELLEEDVLRHAEGLRDPHICSVMKLRYHYLTMMDQPDAFDEDEVREFSSAHAIGPSDYTIPGEPLAKWVRVEGDGLFNQPKEEMLSNRRKLGEYCLKLLEDVEEPLTAKLLLPPDSGRPSGAMEMGDILCRELSKECSPAKLGGSLAGLDLSGLPPEIAEQLRAQHRQGGEL